jgi:hypothetical protein
VRIQSFLARILFGYTTDVSGFAKLTAGVRWWLPPVI